MCDCNQLYLNLSSPRCMCVLMCALQDLVKQLESLQADDWKPEHEVEVEAAPAEEPAAQE